MIYLFNDVKELTGTVRNNHILNLLYEREKNGIYSVSAEIPVTYNDQGTVYNYNKKIQKSDFLGHYDREGRFQLHKIAAVDIENGSIFVKGIHIFFDEAKAGAIIQDRRFVDREIIDGARVAFESIGWSVADFDVSVSKTYNFYNVTPLEARQILVETFGFEFDYWLDFDGKKVTNRHVAVKEKIGEQTNKRYTYGHNVLNIRAEQDYSEIYTAVIGRGKGEEIEETGGYGRRIEYTDVVWSTPSKPLNKPAGTRILEDPNATQLFGYKENGVVKPRVKVEVFSDIESPTELIQASYEWLMDNNVPKAVFSLKVADGDGLNLGDEVYVIYRDIDLVKSARVEKVIDDLVSGNRDVEFGDTAYFDTDRRLSGIQKNLKRIGSEQGGAIYNLKKDFDRRFEEEVEAFRAEFEQAKIDIFAEIEADRANMEALLDTKLSEFNTAFNADMAEAYRLADENYGIIRDEITDKVDASRINLESKITDAVALWEARAIQDYDALDDRITTDINNARLEMEMYSEQAAEHALEQAEVKATELANAVKSELEGVTNSHESMLSELESNVLDIDEYLGTARNITLDQRLLNMTQTFDERIQNSTRSASNMIRGSRFDESDLYTSYFTGTSVVTAENINFVRFNTIQGTLPVIRMDGELHLKSGIEYHLHLEYRTDNVTELDGFVFYHNDGRTERLENKGLFITNLKTTGSWEHTMLTLNPTEEMSGRLALGTRRTFGTSPDGIIDVRLPYLTATAHDQWLPHPLDANQNIEEISRRITQLEDGYSEFIVRSVWDSEMNSLNQTIRNYQTTVDGVEDTIIQLQDSEVITRGREVLDTVDGFQRKVWMGDFDRPNMIPYSVFSSPEARNEWRAWGRYGSTYGGTFRDYAIMGDRDSAANIGIVSPDIGEYIETGKQYTLTWEASAHYPQTTSIHFQYMHLLNVGDTDYSHRLPEPTYETIGTGTNVVYRKYNLTFRVPEGINPDTRILFGTHTTENNINAFFRFRHPKLEEGAVASPFKTSFSMIEQRADEISLAVQGIDLDGMLTQSDIRIEPGYVQLGSQRLGDSQLASIFRVSPNSIRAITDRMILNGDLYVDGDITALAVRAIEGNFSRLFAAQVTAGSVHADYIEGFSARFASLYTLNANIERLVAQNVFTNAVTTKSLDAVNANIGSLRTSILTSNVIKSGHVDSKVISAEHIVVDNTLVNLITARSVFADAITTKTLDAINANVGSLRTAILTSNVITSNHIQVGTALVQKLFASSARIDELITKSHFVTNVKAMSIEAVDGQFSSLITKYLSANYIDVDYINGKNAWFTTQYVMNANIARLTAQTAFIRDIQAIEITANQLNIQTLQSKLKGVEGGLTIYGPDGRVLINNSVLRASFDVQIFDSYAGSSVNFGGLNYVTSSSFWQTFKYFYTDFKGSQLLISWAVGIQSGNSSSDYAEVRVRGFGGSSNPITTRSSRQLVKVGETTYHNQIITLGVPNYNTIQAYLEFRRSPTGTHIDNRVTARILRVSMIN